MTTDNFCFYLQNRLIQTGQTGGQLYIDTSPFSVPWPFHQGAFTLARFRAQFRTKLAHLEMKNILFFAKHASLMRNRVQKSLM